MPDILGDVRIVSLAVNLPGPLAASRLSALGASVTKVESPSGDPLASGAPGWYAELLGNQKVVTLDLKESGDLATLSTLLADADLLITAMRPSAPHRLGLGNVVERYPGLSHVEIVGHDGDTEDVPGHDLTYQAAAGTLQPPLMPTVPVADFLGAERAVSAALLALVGKAKNFVGQRHRIVLEAAAVDAGAAVRHSLSGPGDRLGGATPTYGIYETADGYVALGALEPHFRARALEALEVEDTREAFEQVFASGTTEQWEALAERADIPLLGIRTELRGSEK
ncbi:CoA transferase [Rhodococcus sp. ARC_M6]|uniref:CoA transferase n=1 Tax=Rhodococcus sp. ARC_M6 TaxID=2928852 RepID=UPI001FB1ABA5|nr:CoA transferase [Rhodococcus sp. ARC_M6]MCJ0907270.1 CoA transferase [Rhodococcus sp. ARC_M6]